MTDQNELTWRTRVVVGTSAHGDATPECRNPLLDHDHLTSSGIVCADCGHPLDEALCELHGDD